jgi:hypothetical protein
MAEPDNLVLEQLRLMRADIGTMKDELGRKIGALAESLVGIKKDIRIVDSRLDALDVSVHRIGQDIGTLALAVDEHTHRLERMEDRLNLHDAE